MPADYVQLPGSPDKDTLGFPPADLLRRSFTDVAIKISYSSTGTRKREINNAAVLRLSQVPREAKVLPAKTR